MRPKLKNIVRSFVNTNGRQNKNFDFYDTTSGLVFTKLLRTSCVHYLGRGAIPQGRVPRACTLKHYGFLIYGKMTYFIISVCLFLGQTHKLEQTNTLAYYIVGTSRISDAFIIQTHR